MVFTPKFWFKYCTNNVLLNNCSYLLQLVNINMYITEDVILFHFMHLPFNSHYHQRIPAHDCSPVHSFCSILLYSCLLLPQVKTNSYQQRYSISLVDGNYLICIYSCNHRHIITLDWRLCAKQCLS